jgi:hypothetical protein
MTNDLMPDESWLNVKERELQHAADRGAHHYLTLYDVWQALKLVRYAKSRAPRQPVDGLDEALKLYEEGNGRSADFRPIFKAARLYAEQQQQLAGTLAQQRTTQPETTGSPDTGQSGRLNNSEQPAPVDFEAANLWLVPRNLSEEDVEEILYNVNRKYNTSPLNEHLLKEVFSSTIFQISRGRLTDHLAASGHLAGKPAQPKEPKRHRWDRDGERCLDCGDKDWMDDPVCTPPAQPEIGTQA